MNNCAGCFANGSMGCSVLTGKRVNNCHFYKTVAQHKRDRKHAAERLRVKLKAGDFDNAGLSPATMESILFEVKAYAQSR